MKMFIVALPILLFLVVLKLGDCISGPEAPEYRPNMLASFEASTVKLADCVADPSKFTPENAQYRNDTFDFHMCGPSGIEPPRLEYSWPTNYTAMSGMMAIYGETVTKVPGTNYVDMANPLNRAAIIRYYQKRALGIAADGWLIDCPMECSPGQQLDVVTFYAEAKAALPSLILMPNFGSWDAWTAPLLSAWGMLAASANAEFCQVAFQTVRTDVSGKPLKDAAGKFIRAWTGSQYARVMSVATARANAGDLLVVGVYDPERADKLTFDQLSAWSYSAKPNVFWHYNSSIAPGAPVSAQNPNHVAIPPAPLPELGLLSPINGPLYAPADNWWNLRVDNAPLDPQSLTIINAIKSYDHHYVHPDMGSGWGIPYAVVGNETPLVPVTFGNTSESDKGYPGGAIGYPIPAAAKTNLNYIESGGRGDRHLLLYHRDLRAAFELSYAEWTGTNWKAGYGAVFKLGENYRRPEGWTSTDAAGLCVAAGLIRYDEVYGTEPIRHAHRFSVKVSNGYVWPASHASANQTNGQPMGLRLRLKQSVDIDGLTASLAEPHRSAMRRLFTSFRDYGILCADRGGNLYVQGTLDPRWSNAVLNPTLHRLNADSFEVVKKGWKPTT